MSGPRAGTNARVSQPKANKPLKAGVDQLLATGEPKFGHLWPKKKTGTRKALLFLSPSIRVKQIKGDDLRFSTV